MRATGRRGLYTLGLSVLCVMAGVVTLVVVGSQSDGQVIGSDRVMAAAQRLRKMTAVTDVIVMPEPVAEPSIEPASPILSDVKEKDNKLKQEEQPAPIPRRACRLPGNHGDRTTRYRNSTIEGWYSDGCKQWGLTGEWRRRSDRRIYYAFPFGGEIEILSVVLAEVYPEVDVIIILEATVTWRGDPKPLLYPSFNTTAEGARYWDKVRYIPYSFEDPIMKDRLSRCMTEVVAGPRGSGPVACRWLRQWGARDHMVRAGARDIAANDVFLIADLDELIAREFLRATRHCEVWPEPLAAKGEQRCGRVGIHTFGHKYHFGCTVAKNFGHFHPDMVLGRCLDTFGGEELRRLWGMPKRYFPKPGPDKLLKDSKYVGPAGWHMHSFLSSSQVLWKWFSRSGSNLNNKGTWSPRDLDMIVDRRKKCNEHRSYFSFDALACEPLPHLVRERARQWAHFIKYLPDSSRPDPMGTEQWYREKLVEKLDSHIDPNSVNW